MLSIKTDMTTGAFGSGDFFSCIKAGSCGIMDFK